MKKRIMTVIIVLLALFMALPVGAAEPPVYTSGPFRYEIENGTAMVTGYTGEATKRIQVPETLDGYMVTTIRTLNDLPGEIVYIPKTVSRVYNASHLDPVYNKAYEAAADSPYFKSTEDGVLLSKDGTVLCAYPPGKPDKIYKLPKGVKQIGAHAMSNVNRISELIFPYGFEAIEENGLDGANNLRELVFPITLKWYEDKNYLSLGYSMLERVVFYGPAPAIYPDWVLPESPTYPTPGFEIIVNEKYKQDHGFITQYELTVVDDPFPNRLEGDINGDTLVNISDVIDLRLLILDSYNMTPQEGYLADINADALADVSDVVDLRGMICGRIIQ